MTALTTSKTRRAMLGVIGFGTTALAISVAPAIAAPPAPSKDLPSVEAAWAEWKRYRAAYNAQPENADDESLLDRADEMEKIIQKAGGSSPRIAEIKLWIALSSMVHYSGEDNALHREDHAYLAAHASEMDWNTQLVIGAIGALRSVEA